MARTLADLTLRLTREFSALEARCAKEVEQVERTRDGALAKIDSLEGALKRYDAGLAKAKQTQWKAVQKANESRDRATRAAEAARRPNMSKQERAYRKAKAWALRDRDIALRNAKAIRQTARRKTRGRPLSQHRAIRRAADRAFEQAVQKAREVYQTTLEKERFCLSVSARGNSGAGKAHHRGGDVEGRPRDTERGHCLRAGPGSRRSQVETPNEQARACAPNPGTVRSKTISDLEGLRPKKGRALQEVLSGPQEAQSLNTART